jgi:hypothetical protein
MAIKDFINFFRYGLTVINQQKLRAIFEAILIPQTAANVIDNNVASFAKVFFYAVIKGFHRAHL